MRQVDALPVAADTSPDMASAASAYVPPDPTQIESSPVSLAFWSVTLSVEAARLEETVARVGPELEIVKQELGVGGV